MGYEKMTDLGTDSVTALGGNDSKTGKANPTQIEGYYLGARTVQTTNGPSVIHVFQTPKGNQGVWGTKKLNDNLTKSAVGKMMLIKYKGKIKITGGKTQHTYEFLIDKSNAIEVEVLPEGAVRTEDEEVDTDDGGYDDVSATENDEDVAQQAELMAAERKAKVQAMLNKSKTK